jgi:hypothetical protein
MGNKCFESAQIDNTQENIIPTRIASEARRPTIST